MPPRELLFEGFDGLVGDVDELSRLPPLFSFWLLEAGMLHAGGSSTSSGGSSIGGGAGAAGVAGRAQLRRIEKGDALGDRLPLPGLLGSRWSCGDPLGEMLGGDFVAGDSPVGELPAEGFVSSAPAAATDAACEPPRRIVSGELFGEAAPRDARPERNLAKAEAPAPAPAPAPVPVPVPVLVPASVPGKLAHASRVCASCTATERGGCCAA
jgi:hypothetical protein